MRKQENKIDYTEHKQEAYQKFNSAILNFILRNGGLANPWGGSVSKDSKLDFDFSVYNGKVGNLRVGISSFPVAVIRELVQDGLTGLYYVKLNDMTVVNGMPYFKNPLPITKELELALNSFCKTFLRLPRKCSNVSTNKFDVSVNFSSLSYYFYKQGDLVTYTSLDDWSSI
jgi:hypothetical protein